VAPAATPTIAAGRKVASSIYPDGLPVAGGPQPNADEVLLLTPNGSTAVLLKGALDLSPSDGPAVLVVAAGDPARSAPYGPRFFSYAINEAQSPDRNLCEYVFAHWLPGVPAVDVSFDTSKVWKNVPYGGLTKPHAAPRSRYPAEGKVLITDSRSGRLLFTDTTVCFYSRVLLTLEPDAQGKPTGYGFPI
jgi:hypothetical protein